MHNATIAVRPFRSRLSHRLAKLTTAVLLALAIGAVLGGCSDPIERKAQFLKSGQDYLASKDYDKAEIEFKNVLQIDPKDPEAYYHMGLLEEQKQNIRRAFGLFSKALEYNPDHFETKVKLARYYIGFDLEKALEINNEVLIQQPDNTDALINKALILTKQNDVESATQELRDLLTKKPSSVEATLALSAIYALNKNHGELKSLLIRSIDSNPDAVSLRKALAKVYYQEKKYSGTEQQLEKIIELATDEIAHRLALAQFYVVRKQPDKAEKVLRDAIAADPQDQKKYAYLVEFLSKQYSGERAVGELKTIIKEQPTFELLKFDLAKRHLSKQQFAEADAIYSKLIDEQGQDRIGFQARQAYAKSLLAQGNQEKALGLLDEILEEKPKDNDALLLKGKVALKKGDATEAVSLFRQVLRDQPNNANVHQLLANALNRTGSPDVAREHMEKAVALDPKNITRRIQLAGLLGKTGKHKQALDLLDVALKETPDDLNILKAKSSIQAVQGDKTGMENTLNTIRERHPELAQADFKLGQLFFSEKQYTKAAAAYRTALDKQPDYVEALAGLLDVYQAQDTPNKSEKELKLFLGKYPKNAVANGMLGAYHLTQKQYPDAIKTLELALQEQPGFSNAMSMLVNAHQQQGTLDQVMAYLNKKIAENSDHPIAYSYLGKIYISQKKLKLAEKALIEAKRIVPKNPTIYKSLADLYWIEKNREKAIAALKEGIAAMPNNTALQMELGMVYIASKDFQQAIAIYENVVKTNPKQIWAKNNLAALLSDHMPDAQSLNKAYELALSLKDINHPTMQDTLGWVYYKLDDADQSIPLLEKAAKGAPKSSSIQYHLAMAFHKKGENEKAKLHLSKALDLKESFPEVEKAKELFERL